MGTDTFANVAEWLEDKWRRVGLGGLYDAVDDAAERNIKAREQAVRARARAEGKSQAETERLVRAELGRLGGVNMDSIGEGARALRDGANQWMTPDLSEKVMPIIATAGVLGIGYLVADGLMGSDSPKPKLTPEGEDMSSYRYMR